MATNPYTTPASGSAVGGVMSGTFGPLGGAQPPAPVTPFGATAQTDAPTAPQFSGAAGMGVQAAAQNGFMNQWRQGMQYGGRGIGNAPTQYQGQLQQMPMQYPNYLNGHGQIDPHRFGQIPNGMMPTWQRQAQSVWQGMNPGQFNPQTPWANQGLLSFLPSARGGMSINRPGNQANGVQGLASYIQNPFGSFF